MERAASRKPSLAARPKHSCATSIWKPSFAVDFQLGERAFLSNLLSLADTFGRSDAILQPSCRPETSFDAASLGRLPGLLDATGPPTTLLATPTAAVALGAPDCAC